MNKFIWLSVLVLYVHGSCLNQDDILYRSFDGTCNNLLYTNYGKTGNTFLRSYAPYNDTMTNRVSPRVISNTIASTQQSLKNGKGINTLEFMFGQFVNHDLQSTLRSPFPLYIELPEGDFLIGLKDTPTFGNKSYIIINDTQTINGEVINEATSWLDLSTVYGNSDIEAVALRNTDGTLKTSQQYACKFPPPFFSELPCNSSYRVTFEELPPSITQVPELQYPDVNFPPRPDGTGVMNSGDFRVNGNVALTLLHTLFIREHNRIVEELKEDFPYANGKFLYDTARKLNIAQYQNIVFYEYLPTIVPTLNTSQLSYPGYNVFTNPDTSYIFDNVAFRYGHSAFDSYQARDMCNETFTVVPDWYTQIVNPYQDITKFVFAGTSGPEPFLIPDVLSAARTPENVWYSLIYNEGGKIDTLVVDDLRNLGAGFFPIDLFAVDIVRARIARVPNYVTLRNDWFSSTPSRNKIYGTAQCPLSYQTSSVDDPIECFSVITSDINLANKLKQLYKKVKYIDAVVGVLSEDIANNAVLPPTISNIIYNEYNRKRVSDRFWFERIYSKSTLRKIKSRKLSDLLIDNFDIPSDFPFKNENAFLVPNNVYSQC